MTEPVTKDNPRFMIVGGGLAGALMANYLGKAGREVAVYEKRPDLRTAKIVTGRSINLALSVRGIHALKEIGVADAVMADAVPMPGRMIHDLDGRLNFQPYGQSGQAINSVSRAGLNIILLNTAERYETVSLHFNHKCVDVDLDAPAADFLNSETGERTRVEADIILGADGAFSAVRNRMQRLDRFSYSIDYLEHGYKELIIPPAPGGGFRMEKYALHIWPRRSHMMIALPNADGSYTVTCFWRHEGPNSFANLTAMEAVQDYFREHFPDAVPHMPTLTNDYLENPVGSLATVRCGPWVYQDKIALMGDAAHAVVPFYGQGMNAAFEDCTALNECLANYAPDYARALNTYYDLRKENADAIADLAIGNFIEMRDHVGSRSFLRKKQREKLLHRLFPNWYIPSYTMVSFTRIPYAETVRRAKRQDRIVRRVSRIFMLLGLAIIVIVFIVLSGC